MILLTLRTEGKRHCIQLFRESLSAKMGTRQSRKVIWDMINTLFLTLSVAVKTYYFPLARANIRPRPLVPFFQISLRNGELKTTHNTFRDCRCTFSDNLSRNSCIFILHISKANSGVRTWQRNTNTGYQLRWNSFSVFVRW